MLPDDRTKIGSSDSYKVRKISETEEQQRPQPADNDDRKRSKFQEALKGTDEKKRKPLVKSAPTEKQSSPFELFQQTSIHNAEPSENDADLIAIADEEGGGESDSETETNLDSAKIEEPV